MPLLDYFLRPMALGVSRDQTPEFKDTGKPRACTEQQDAVHAHVAGSLVSSSWLQTFA